MPTFSLPICKVLPSFNIYPSLLPPPPIVTNLFYYTKTTQSEKFEAELGGKIRAFENTVQSTVSALEQRVNARHEAEAGVASKVESQLAGKVG